MRVDEAFVISLPERSERLIQFQKSLPQDWPFPTPVVHPGVRESAPSWYKSSDGAWGCRQAHLQLLRSAWTRGVQSTLILEDDAVLCDRFTERWQEVRPRIPAKTSMFMLGGQHISAPAYAGQHLVRCVNTRRTHAYIIRLKALPHLINIWSAARRHIDHSLTQFQADTYVYGPTQFLIGQDSGWSDISGNDNPSVRFWA